MPLKDGSYKGPHWATRRALLEILKREGAQSSHAMAAQLGVSPMAVRQHMQELETAGDVAASDRSAGKGRPTKIWTLTPLAERHFPDRHRDLMLDLLRNVQSVLGEAAMERLLEERGNQQIAAYRDRLRACRTTLERLVALAEIRSEEGYMAEVSALPDGSLQLIENHCPICAAASVCSGLCARELQVFGSALGPGCRIERAEHLLSGARRCAYRVTEGMS